MTENTKVGIELYYLIQEIIKDSLRRIELQGNRLSNDHYSESSEELYFKIVEYLHTKIWYNPASTSYSTLVNRSAFVREVTSSNEPTKKGGSQ